MDDEIHTSERVDEQQTTREYWGAKDSLRRNAGLNKRASDEVTPLLGDGQGDDVDNNRRGSEWEGHADFEGLTWWHKPSVRTLLLHLVPLSN